MKNFLFILFVWSLAFPFANTANSGVCVCPLVPFFPTSGGNWFHYAGVCHTTPTGCKDDYPTGYSGPPTSGRSCSTSPGSCVNCIDVGGTAPSAARSIDVRGTTPANFTMYIGDPKNNAASYQELGTEDRTKAYLKAYAPEGSNTKPYDSLRFTPAFAMTYEKPFVVLLTRTVEGVCEEFYAIVWQVQGTEPNAKGYLGIEIFGPSPNGVSVLNPCHVCNAVVTASDGAGGVQHTPIPGLLQVQFSSSKYDVAYVRLHDSDKNRNAGYKPCKP